jgi:shikimate kinase
MDHGVAIGGFMGVGKSTVGRLVAERLSLPFVDLDHRVSAEANMPVADIFATEGEDGFRRREAEAVRQMVAGERVVLALGGGTLHHGDNLAQLRARFFVVSLTAPIEVIADRIGSEDGARPLWGDAASLYRQREAGYAAADAMVAVGDLKPADAADAVMAVLPW